MTGVQKMAQKAGADKAHVDGFREALDEDRRAELRAVMAAAADDIALAASTVCNFLELRDDVGAVYAVRRLAAYCHALEAAAVLLHKATAAIETED